MDIVKKSIDMLRGKRHDYMNKLQVIYGFLQMERYKEAEEYIMEMIQENTGISEICNLGDEYFSFCFEHIINLLQNEGIRLNLNIEISELKKKIFENGFNKKYNIVNNIIIEFVNLKSNIVYIDLFENGAGVNLIFSNTEDYENLINELLLVENTEIEEAKMYRYESDNKLIYNLVFTK